MEKVYNINNMKVKIKLEEYNYDCSDGCCTNYGTITSVNGEELSCHNQDVETILRGVLEKLGYDVDIESIYT